MTPERLATLWEESKKDSPDIVPSDIRCLVIALEQAQKDVTALKERLQSESKDRQLIAEALDRVAKEKIALEERLRQAEPEVKRLQEVNKAGAEWSFLQINKLRQEGKAQEKHIAELEAEKSAMQDAREIEQTNLYHLADDLKIERLYSTTLKNELKAKDEQIRLLREALEHAWSNLSRRGITAQDWVREQQTQLKAAKEALAQTEEKTT